jgi:phosphate transport system permease protein
MIVLMATGNTPIMNWSPFNGFRALSANVAVELPEAPDGGTLFRVLFVAALLLFALTFLLNTAAELIRLRLRQRYRTL